MANNSILNHHLILNKLTTDKAKMTNLTIIGTNTQISAKSRNHNNLQLKTKIKIMTGIWIRIWSIVMLISMQNYRVKSIIINNLTRKRLWRLKLTRVVNLFLGCYHLVLKVNCFIINNNSLRTYINNLKAHLKIKNGLDNKWLCRMV